MGGRRPKGRTVSRYWSSGSEQNPRGIRRANVAGADESLPDSNEWLFERLRALEVGACPFANLPEKTAGRWGQGLTAEKMKECRWLQPEIVGRFEFAEWTPDNHLRHPRFIGLREDKDARTVRREL